MASFLRTNTAVTLCVGPFLDKTDGVTAKTALTVSNCKTTITAETDDNSAPTLIIYNVAGNDATNTLAHITNDVAGYYSLKVTAANLNRLGRVKISIQDAANHCPVFHEFVVLPAMIYDSLVSGTDALDTSVIQVLGTAVTAATAGVMDVNTSRINNVAATSVTTIAANVGTTQPVNFTGTGASAYVKSDMVDIAGATVSTSSAQIGCNAVQHGGTVQTGRDIGASVLLSSGTGTGQLDFTSGVVKSNLVQILATALTETAGQIAAAFKKFFDKASPTGTINSLPDAVAGAAGGVFIAGTNAATTVTTALTTTFTGNLTGSVGSVATGGITAASFAAGAIDATAIAANAIGASELATDAAEEIADTILGRNVAGGSNTGRLVKEALYPLRNKVVVSSGTMTVYQTDDTTSSWTAAVSGTAGADPITTIDPA